MAAVTLNVYLTSYNAALVLITGHTDANGTVTSAVDVDYVGDGPAVLPQPEDGAVSEVVNTPEAGNT